MPGWQCDGARRAGSPPVLPAKLWERNDTSEGAALHKLCYQQEEGGGLADAKQLQAAQEDN